MEIITGPYDLINFPAMLFLLAVLTIYLFPFLAYGENEILYFHHPEKKRIDILITICTVSGLYAVVFYGAYLPQFFAGDISANRIAMVREGDLLIGYSMFHTLAAACCSFFHISIFLALYCYIFQRAKKWTILALLVSSFCEPLHMFSQYGRDGVVNWIFAAVVSYLILRPFIPSVKRKPIRTVYSLSSIPLLIGFALISQSRFQENLLYQICNYIGRSLRNFNFHYCLRQHVPSTKGFLTFPIINYVLSALGFSTKVSPSMVRKDLFNDGIRFFDTHTGIFGTFVAELCYDYTLWQIIVFSLLLSFLIHRILRIRNNTLAFSQALVLLLFGYFMLIGIFYFRLGLTVQGNFLMFVSIFAAWFMCPRYNQEL